MTLALEINDAGLVLARDGHVVAEVPGYAMLDGREPQTGRAAERRARLQPLYAESRHWQELGTAALPRQMPAANSYAEVAYAQLAQLAREADAAGSEALYAVPAWYTREQLAVLLGVAREAGLPAVGLVDAGVAAAALEPVPVGVVQLELSLHCATVTVLEHVVGFAPRALRAAAAARLGGAAAGVDRPDRRRIRAPDAVRSAARGCGRAAAVGRAAGLAGGAARP